jgi:hypothetical protein
MAKNESFEDLEFGIGEKADGTLDIFPKSELPARLAAQKAQHEANEYAMKQVFPDDQDLDLESLDVRELDEIIAAMGGDAQDAKSSKTEAGYVGPGAKRPKGQQCGLCSMFVSPDGCTVVAGGVEPAGWCKLFERGARESANHDLSEVLQAARALDCMDYLSGVKRVMLVEDKDQWNAEYDFDRNTITIQGKLLAQPNDEQIRTVLHEGGHHAQFKKDKATFAAFKREGLGSTANFIAIANKAHTEDYQRTGWVDDIAGETFAESYARFCLGMEMPQPLRNFWNARGPAWMEYD